MLTRESLVTLPDLGSQWEQDTGGINPTKSPILRGPHSAGGVFNPALGQGVAAPPWNPVSGSPQQAAGHRILVKLDDIELFAPLISRDRLAGILVLGEKKSGRYSPEGVSLLEDIAERVAVSMEKEYFGSNSVSVRGSYR